MSALALTFAACDEDYKDWADPQVSTEGSADNVAGSITAFSAIDGNKATGLTPILVATAQDGNSVSVASLTLNDESIDFTMSNDTVLVDATVLAEASKKAYSSMAPVTRELTVAGHFAMKTERGESFPLSVEPFIVNYTPAALPANASEEAYYFIGSANGWDLAAPTPFVSKGDGKYELTIELTADEWFAFAPQSAVDNQDWNALFRAPSNGCEDQTGFLDSDPTTGFSFNHKDDSESREYTFVLDMVNYTYSYARTVHSLYYSGDANSWGASPLAETEQGSGIYVGYYYIASVDNSSTWGMKFRPNAGDNWDGQLGAGATDYSIIAGGGNIVTPENKSGFYQITVNTKESTYAISEITSISLIGSSVYGADGNPDTSWGTDADMTYNTETGAWEYTGALAAGEFKFRANHDWTLSWGGDTAETLTSANGANLKIEAAGNYTITFKPNCDGQGVYTIQ